MKNSMKGRWATLKSFSLLLRHLSYGLLEIRWPFSTLLALALPLSLLIAGWRSRRSRQAPGAVWYLSLTCTLQLLLLLVANEWLQVLDDTRTRYLATLWPPAVLLIGVALLHPKRALLRPPGGLVLVALMAFLGTSDYLYKGELTRSWSWRDLSFPIAATRLIAAEGSASGFLVLDRSLLGGGRVYELYTGAYDKRRGWLETHTTSDRLLRRTQDSNLVWLVSRSSYEQILHLPSHIERFKQDGWIHSRPWQDSVVTLDLLLSPLSTARGRLQFESAATLLAPDDLQLRDGRLLFWAGLRSDDETFLDRHSLAIHIIDSRSGVRVAQGDTGVGPGTFVRLRSEIDVSALPPGDYEVRVALYNWQTGERLSARGSCDVRSQRHAHAAPLPARLKRQDNTHGQECASLHARVSGTMLAVDRKQERTCRRHLVIRYRASPGCGPCYPCCWPPHWSCPFSAGTSSTLTKPRQ